MPCRSCVNIKDVRVHSVDDSLPVYIGADMLTHGKNIYAKKSESTDLSNPKMQYELTHQAAHPKKKNRQILCYSTSDTWVQAERRR